MSNNLRKDIITIISENPNYKNMGELYGLIEKVSGRKFGAIKSEITKLIAMGDLIIIDNRLKIGKDRFVVAKELRAQVLANNKGYAFCKVLDSDEPDYFIPPTKLNGAVHNDIVIIKPSAVQRVNQSKEAEIVKIIKRANETIVGIYYELGGTGYVVPDDQKYSTKVNVKFFPGETKPKSGERVVVSVKWAENAFTIPTGKVIENLGEANSIDSLQLGIIREHNLIEEFPPQVLEECENFKAPTESDVGKRVDLRGKKIFTIDGADAKDLDDAVNISVLPNGNFKLGVHIADVTNYVKAGTLVEAEAKERGTSVYFPNFVLPMLPQKLSNDLCSLHPHTDKLTLSCLMEINRNGNVVNYEICESVINSCHRLTYDRVKQVFDGDAEACEELKDIKGQLDTMHDLSKILEKKRGLRGALDFDISESYFEIDENTNQVLDVKFAERNDAHKLIESFMVVANETVAKHFHDLEMPFVYRVHGEPNMEKLKEVVEMIAHLGVSVPQVPKKPDALFFDKLLNATEDEQLREVINKIVLRAMDKAKYSPDCTGHFGLASEFYCHFTSPIRRLADLTIHSIIKEQLKYHTFSKKRIDQLDEIVAENADQASVTERNADSAERKVDDLRKAQFMKDKVGMEYSAIVTGITKNYVYATLPNSVECCIDLNPYLSEGRGFSKDIVNPNSLKMGDKIKVRITEIDMMDRHVKSQCIQNLENRKEACKPTIQVRKKFSDKKRAPAWEEIK